MPGAPARDASGRPRSLRVLFLFRNLGYVRLFDRVIRELLARGHSVHLLHERAGYSPTEAAWLADIEREPGFTWSLARAIDFGRWTAVGEFLRRLADYLHARSPRFVGGSALVARSQIRVQPWLARLLEAPPLRSERGRRFVEELVAAAEAAVPTSPELVAELGATSPDVLVLAPHLMPGTRHEEYVKAARALAVPTCMCIASWDNLSTKQRIRELPDRVVVWNDVQRREARELHGVPADRIAVTGAQSFDEWFEREPRPRAEFLRLVGLDADRPYLLYVAGALFPAALTEAEWVRDVWIPALRRDERLRDVGVLVRPHPRRAAHWRAVPLGELERVAVWPAGDAPMPVDEESRRDFYDSIFHSSAVVGINTTAMIEAAIVGRPVHTVLAPEFEDSQRGTHHFNYLLEVGGGAVRTAGSLDEHRDQLAAALAGGDETGGRREGFLREFVRPHGLELPALPFVVAEIESVAAQPPRPVPAIPARLLALRVALRSAMAVSRSVRRVRRLASRGAAAA